MTQYVTIVLSVEDMANLTLNLKAKYTAAKSWRWLNTML